MENITLLRQWAWSEAKSRLPDSATVAQIIVEAKKLEAYLDINQNPEKPKAMTTG